MSINIQNVLTNEGNALKELSNESPILLVFLRHFGCIFCREALDDISEKITDIKASNVEVVFVHMTSFEIAETYFEEYNIKGVQHISDPDCNLYEEFGLTKGRLGQLFGLKTWIRGFELRKKGIQYSLDQIGDSFQMPGIFLLRNGKIIESYIHKDISDKPDYEKLISCCSV